MEPENPLLDDFLVSSCRRPGDARVCFVPTASGDSPGYVERFRDAFEGRATTSVLSLFSRDVTDLRAFVLDQDVIYVGGGSTVNLLAVWRAHGLDMILRDALAAGVVLAGISAGMNCWFDASLTDSFGPDRLDPLHDGLGLIEGSACAHYDGEEMRRPAYLDLVRSDTLPAGFAADDGCALLFRDGHLAEAVSSRPGSRAFHVQRTDGRVAEQPIAVRHLGSGR